MKMLKTVGLTAILAALAVSSFAEPVVYAWDPASPQTSFGDGRLVLTLDENQRVTSIAADPQDDVIVLQGVGEASLALAAEAAVTNISAGRLEFALPLDLSGDVDFMTAPRAIEYSGDFLDNEAYTVVFEDRTLDEWTPFTAVHDRPPIPEGVTAALTGESHAYCVERGSGWLECQFQKVDGVYTKGLKVRFEQQGDDIAAKIVWAGYVVGSCIGQDLKSVVGYEGYTVLKPGMTVATHAYGIDVVRMMPLATSGDEIRLTRAVTGAGTLTAHPEMKVAFVGDAVASADGTLGQSLAFAEEGGAFVFADRLASPWMLSGTVAGAYGTLDFAGYSLPKELVPAGEVTLDGPNSIPYSGTTFNVFESNWVTVDLPSKWSAVTEVKGFMRGPYCCNPNGADAHIYFLSNSTDNTQHFYQSQVKDGAWLKVVPLIFRESPGRLEVRTDPSNSRYASASTYDYGTIMYDGDGFSTKYGSGYHLQKLTLTYDAYEKDLPPTEATNAATFAAVGCRLVVRGTSSADNILHVPNADGLPKNGTVDVKAHGILDLNCLSLDLNDGYAKGTSVINVYPGGVIRQSVGGSVFAKDSQRVVVDGGEVVFGYGQSNFKDAGTYANLFTLRNGARLTGLRYPRLAYNTVHKMVVDGETGSFIDTGLVMTGPENGRKIDFTFETAADLTINGEMIPYGGVTTHHGIYDNDLTNCVVHKTGAATVHHYGTYWSPAPICIEEGTWEICSATAFPSEQGGRSVELLGGTLAVADGIAAELGSLSATNTTTKSHIVLGEESSLRVRARIPAEQLRNIRIGRHRVQQDEDGFLHEILGMNIFVR